MKTFWILNCLSLALGSNLIVLEAQAAANTQSLEERIGELEANSQLNLFKFRAVFTDRVDSVVARSESTGQTVNTTHNRLRFSLGFAAEATESLKAYAKLTMTKYSNDTLHTGQDPASFQNPERDLTVTHSYNSPGLWVENAYFDYLLSRVPLTFSAGRLPTMNGSPTHIWNGSARMGTYPRLAYNTPLDGFGLTLKMDRWLPQNNELAFRLIYTPFTQRDANTPTALPKTNNNSGTEPSNSTLLTGMIDYNLKHQPAFDLLNVIFQYSTLNNFAIGDGQGNSAGQTINFYSNIKLNVQMFTGHIEVDDVYHSGFDLVYSRYQSTVKSDGVAILSSAVGSLPAGTPIGGWGVATQMPNYLSTSGSFSGSIDLFDVRYKFKWKQMNDPFLGAEYQMGSKEVFFEDGANEDVTGFYKNRGSGYHLYWLQPIDEGFSVRLGYINQQQNYAPITFGAATESKINYTSYYGNLRVAL